MSTDSITLTLSREEAEALHKAAAVLSGGVGSKIEVRNENPAYEGAFTKLRAALSNPTPPSPREERLEGALAHLDYVLQICEGEAEPDADKLNAARRACDALHSDSTEAEGE